MAMDVLPRHDLHYVTRKYQKNIYSIQSHNMWGLHMDGRYLHYRHSFWALKYFLDLQIIVHNHHWALPNILKDFIIVEDFRALQRMAVLNPNQTDVWEALPGLGGGLRKPPPAILALEQILAKKLCYSKSWHQFQLIWHLFRFFFQKSPKKWYPNVSLTI